MEITTDLRIGNIVLFSGGYRKVEGIGQESVTLNGQNCPICEIEPVVLDKELLLLCGFESYYNLFEYPVKRFFPFLLRVNDNSRGYVLMFDYRPVTGMVFLYLHQLQNLFSSFTGDELLITIDMLKEIRTFPSEM